LHIPRWVDLAKKHGVLVLPCLATNEERLKKLLDERQRIANEYVEGGRELDWVRQAVYAEQEEHQEAREKLVQLENEKPKWRQGNARRLQQAVRDLEWRVLTLGELG
jgi:predicted  nucleic acid-binding Zn-ribbon protein